MNDTIFKVGDRIMYNSNPSDVGTVLSRRTLMYYDFDSSSSVWARWDNSGREMWAEKNLCTLIQRLEPKYRFPSWL